MGNVPDGRSERRERRLTFALWCNVVIVVVQVVLGFTAHSLGLIADAGHNLTDVVAVVLSLAAVRVARRPATSSRSFGMHRATVLAAQANAASILIVTALVTYEAIRRLAHPAHVNGPIVVVTALVAAAANAIAMLALREPSGHAHEPSGHAHEQSGNAHDHDHSHAQGGDLNMRSVMLHMAGDSAASAGVAVSGLVIALTGGWYRLDPIVSIAIGVLLAVQAWRLLRSTMEVLLEGTPAGLDVGLLTSAMCAVPGVESVHDVHVWTLASDIRALSAHVVVEGQPSLEDAQRVATLVKGAVSAPFAIAHATFELESETCRDDGSWCALDVSSARLPT